MRKIHIMLMLLGLSIVAANPAHAQPMTQAMAQDKPLMIVRFNEPNVRYARPLYTVLQKALEIKPDAMFDIVALKPVQQNPAQFEAERADVVATLTRIGLPASRYTITVREMEVPSSEFLLFAN